MSSRVLQALEVKQPNTLFTPPIAKAHAYLLGGHAAVKKGLSYMMGLVPESYTDKLSDDFANVVLPLSLITRKNGVYHCLHMVKQAGRSAPKFLVNSDGVIPQVDYANLIPKVHKAHKNMVLLWNLERIRDQLMQFRRLECLCGTRCNISRGCDCNTLLALVYKHTRLDNGHKLPEIPCLSNLSR